MTNSICFDYLAFTTTIDSCSSVINFLGFQDIEFQKIKGTYGYKWQLYYDGIHIHYAGTEEMGICVEFTGRGCRHFESIGMGDYFEVFAYIYANKDVVNITRLDVAYDDYEKLLDFGLICSAIEEEKYLSRFREFKIERIYSKQVDKRSFTVYCGSHQSELRFRIYDKKAEQQRSDLDHWVRFEMQLRRGRALSFIDLLLSGNDINVLFCKVVNNYLRFVDTNDTDSNLSRAETSSWWFDFIKTLDKVSLYVPDVDYTETRLERFVKKQVSSSIVTFIALFGFNAFRDIITGKSKVKLNVKYRNLLFNHGIFNLEELFNNEWWLEAAADTEDVNDYFKVKENETN